MGGIIDTSDLNLVDGEIVIKRGDVISLPTGALKKYRAKLDITGHMLVQLTGLAEGDPDFQTALEPC